MRFVLTPVGSSGDVQPFVGVGRVLRARGHDVTVITAEPFRDLVERAGLDFGSVWSAEEYDRSTRNPDLWHPSRGLKLIFETASRHLRHACEVIEAAHVPGRTVLVGHTLSIATRLVEEVTGAPAATIHLAPNVFRSDFAQPAFHPAIDPSRLPRTVKRALWWLVDRAMIDRHLEPGLNACRRELGLAPVRRPFQSWIHSPQRIIGMFPEWFMPVQPDWPPQLRLTSFPLYDAAEQQPLHPDLETFLGTGAAPVAFTPGTANRHARAFFDVAIDAAGRLGRRAILLTRYAEQLPAALPPHVRHVVYAPFSRLFPRCACVVHHGGIGTSAQALAAGVPQLVMPLAYDQPNNAARLVRLGVGAWIPPRRFTPQGATRAIQGLLESEAVRSACQGCRVALAGRNGAAEACDLLEELVVDARARRQAHDGTMAR